ncbi:hypothetical protein C0993_006520 [Termitomyces sp. T159_Od127]|nr:hypothetical protein C0993_006520 [Termitomyces sp. T159_Od127]
MTTISVKVEFSGGLELLFSNQRTHTIELPAIDSATSKEPNLQYLIEYLLNDADRRPGILVLVNDTDWELEGEGEYVLKNNDEIVFISTLHGG